MIELEVLSITNSASEEGGYLTTLDTLSVLYIGGVILFSAITVSKFIKVYRCFRSSQFDSKKEVFIAAKECTESFSFLRFIHIAKELSEDEMQIVLEHEQIHVKQRHTYDLIYLQLVHIFNWFNPAIFLLKKDLIAVHEYQVDQQMYAHHHKNYVKYLLASTLGVKPSQLILTSQFHNKLKLTQRIKQMKTKKKNNWAILALMPAIALGLTLVSFNSNKTMVSKIVVNEQDTVYDFAQKNPEYPGGHAAMVDFLVKHIEYPINAKKNGVEGTVYVVFTVLKTGKLDNFIIGRKVNEDLEREALRVMKLMPNWIPGEQDGKKVNVQYTLPIQFKL
ncbi:MAG: M56 family metallopeptidase [Putridiphycobacter sp.]|nr:M56 family metallopeptidase [Putridiphycobacter sp.]